MNYSLLNYIFLLPGKQATFGLPSHVFSISKTWIVNKTWDKKRDESSSKATDNTKFRYSKNLFRMFSCFLLHSVFIRTSKITQVVSCVRGGHRIMLVICKVLVFTKFHFYEPFYFYINYFTWFCFCRNKQQGSLLVQMEWQTSELQEIGYFL